MIGKSGLSDKTFPDVLGGAVCAADEALGARIVCQEF